MKIFSQKQASVVDIEAPNLNLPMLYVNPKVVSFDRKKPSEHWKCSCDIADLGKEDRDLRQSLYRS